MADDEIQRGIEFLVQQQAKYEARLEKDESRLTGLEESFKVLVELTRRANERADRFGKVRTTPSHTTNEPMKRTIADRSGLSLDEAFKVLVELVHKHEATGRPRPDAGDTRLS